MTFAKPCISGFWGLSLIGKQCIVSLLLILGNFGLAPKPKVGICLSLS